MNVSNGQRGILYRNIILRLTNNKACSFVHFTKMFQLVVETKVYILSELLHADQYIGVRA